MRRLIARLRPLLVTVGLLPWLAATGAVTAVAADGDVEVRAYDHRDFGRLALEWPSAPVAVEGVPGPGTLTLRPSRPFRGDLSTAAERLRPYLASAAAGPAAGEVVLRLRPGTRHKLFTVEDRVVVVDLFRGEPDLPAIGVRTGRHGDYARVVFDLPFAAGHRVVREGERLTVRFDEPARVDAATIARELAPLVAAAGAEADAGATEVVLRVPPAARVRDFALPENRVVVDIFVPADAGVAEAEAAGSNEPAREGEAASTGPAEQRKAEPPAPAPPPSPTLAASAAAVEDGVELRFEWNLPMPAAVFQRAGYLWVVFGAVPADGEPAPLRFEPDAASGEILGPGEPVVAEAGLALRFPLLRDVEAAVDRDGDTWRVLLSADAPPPRPVTLRRRPDPPRLFLPGAEAVVRLTDPEVGDRLDVLPLAEANRGQPRPRRFVDFRFLETAQGMAWLPLADRLRARPVDGGVELGAPEGLRLTVGPEIVNRPRSGGPERVDPAGIDGPADAASAAVPATAADGAPPSAPRAIEPGNPAVKPADASGPPLGLAAAPAPEPGAPALAVRRRLVERVLSTPPPGRDAARLDLARFLLSRALAAETLAVLGAVDGADGDDGAPAGSTLSRDSLAGAAQLLMGRVREAEAGLTAEQLNGDPEVALWRAMVAAADGDWSRAAQELKRSGRTLAEYPPRLRVRLGLTAALIALESGQPETAFSVLEGLKDLELGVQDRARLRFTEGLALARDGATAAAEQAWRELAAGAPAETRQKALYALTALLLETGRIGPEEALAKLKAARPFWRGHPWEMTMLDGLARVHARRGDHRRALSTWKEVISRRPEGPEAEAIAAAMGELFVATLTAEGDAAPSALEALALYLDFPELSPSGAVGDRLTRRLAERLAELDLVEDAAQLLDRQIRYRLKGPAKAETGAWLGELWLREPDPEAALAALRASATEAPLPPELRSRRRLVEAHAMALQGRNEEALAALEDDRTRPADRLRIAMHFERRAWPKVIEIAARLLPEPAGSVTSLTADEHELLAKLALAYAHLGDREALGSLRNRFGDALARGPAYAAFAMATGGGGGQETGGDAKAALAGAAEQIDAARTLLGADVGS